MKTLETERLLLRPLTEEDLKGWFELDSSPNVHLHLGNNPVTEIDQVKAVLQNILHQYETNKIGRFAVILKETNEFIGWSGLKYITETENGHINFYEIGYRFIERFWGKGYAFESEKAWRDYAFNEIKTERLYASANMENTNSRKILSKIGMTETGTYDWNGIPCVWLELTKADFESL